MPLFNRYSSFLFRITILTGYVLFSYWAYCNRATLPVYIDIVFLFFFIDSKNILSLKNYLIIYAFLLFKLSAWFFFPDNFALPLDGCVYISSFLLGYEIKKIISNAKVTLPVTDQSVLVKNEEKLLLLFKIFIGLKIFYIAFLIYQYGFSSFYSGEMLAEKINNYGQQNTLDGILVILSSFIDNFLVALVALYIKNIAAQGKKPDYYYLAIVLLILPLLILSRSTFAFGIVTLLCVYGYFSKSLFKVYVFFIPVFALLFFVSVYIGTLRLNSYSGTNNATDVTSSDHFFTELTPIVAYNTVKENIHVLKYQYGKTIFLPLFTKVIPRAFWQTKPDNSTAYYAKEFDTDSFYAGFMMPLTIFGDLFLNFGIYISCFILFLLGCLVARVDLIYVNKETKNIDTYFIIFMSFYSFIRNDLPEGLVLILLIFFSKKIIEMAVLKKSTVR